VVTLSSKNRSTHKDNEENKRVKWNDNFDNQDSYGQENLLQFKNEDFEEYITSVSNSRIFKELVNKNKALKDNHSTSQIELKSKHFREHNHDPENRDDKTDKENHKSAWFEKNVNNPDSSSDYFDNLRKSTRN